MREAQVKQGIKDRLKPVGWEIVDTSLPRGGYKQLEGLPDLLCWRNNHFVTIETKSRTGRIEDSQIAFLQRIAPHLGDNVYHFFVSHPDLIPGWMTKP